MTITPFEVYVITRLDTFKSWCGAAAAILVILFVGLLAVMIIRSIYLNDESAVKTCDTLIGFIKKAKLFITLPIAIAATILTPTTKEAAAIKVVPAIANSEIVQDKIPEALGGLIDLANDWMKELSPQNSKGI